MSDNEIQWENINKVFTEMINTYEETDQFIKLLFVYHHPIESKEKLTQEHLAAKLLPPETMTAKLLQNSQNMENYINYLSKEITRLYRNSIKEKNDLIRKYQENEEIYQKIIEDCLNFEKSCTTSRENLEKHRNIYLGLWNNLE